MTSYFQEKNEGFIQTLFSERDNRPKSDIHRADVGVLCGI
jgi:hypothetical protein